MTQRNSFVMDLEAERARRLVAIIQAVARESAPAPFTPTGIWVRP